MITINKWLLSLHEMMTGYANALKELKFHFPSVCRRAIICTGRVIRYNVNRISKPSVAGDNSEEESIQQEKKKKHPQ